MCGFEVRLPPNASRRDRATAQQKQHVHHKNSRADGVEQLKCVRCNKLIPTTRARAAHKLLVPMAPKQTLTPQKPGLVARPPHLKQRAKLRNIERIAMKHLGLSVENLPPDFLMTNLRRKKEVDRRGSGSRPVKGC